MDTVLLQLDDSATASPRAIGRDHGAAMSTGPPQAAQRGATHLGRAFDEVARACAEHPAVVTRRQVYTYDWVLHAADCVRRYLCSRPHHAAGVRVALQLCNSPEYLAAFYGTLLADGVVVPLPVGLERLRWRKIRELCRPDVMISRPEDFSAWEVSAVCTVNLTAASGNVAVPTLRRDGGELAMLLFTSGSTGIPRGVMLSHRNLLANAHSIVQSLPLSPEDRALVVLPFCHAFGNSILHTHMLAGATLVLDGTLTFPGSIVAALRDFAATSLSAVPEIFSMLLRYGGLGESPLKALRYMAVAGGMSGPNLTDEIARRIAPATFHVMYGQSEATARLAVLPPDQLGLRPGAIGKAIAGVELAVMDEAGRALPPGDVGMLCARGENVMLGYWQDPASTAEVLPGDGWLRTGDLAYRDRDGYFYLQGRANLLVKVQGNRVHPLEIEAVVEECFPLSRAVAIPFVLAEQTRFALFVESPDDVRLAVAEIRAVCLRELPRHKVPVLIEVLERLPLTSACKVDRAVLRQRILQVRGHAA